MPLTVSHSSAFLKCFSWLSWPVLIKALHSDRLVPEMHMYTVSGNTALWTSSFKRRVSKWSHKGSKRRGSQEYKDLPQLECFTSFYFQFFCVSEMLTHSLKMLMNFFYIPSASGIWPSITWDGGLGRGLSQFC